jgi:hypothetical protein
VKVKKPIKKKLPLSVIVPAPELPQKNEEIFGDVPDAVTPTFQKAESVERDLTYESALRAIRPIVTPADQKKIDAELHKPYPQDVDRRLAEWRRRHAKGKGVAEQ